MNGKWNEENDENHINLNIIHERVCVQQQKKQNVKEHNQGNDHEDQNGVSPQTMSSGNES